MKKKLLGYGIATVVGILIAALVISTGLAGKTPGKREVFRLLSDAGTVAGLTLVFSSALIAVSEQGLFRGLGYSFSYLWDRMIPGRASRRPETYAGYVERQSKKQSERQSDKTTVPLRRYPLVPGAVFFLLGLVFLVLFYYG